MKNLNSLLIYIPLMLILILMSCKINSEIIYVKLKPYLNHKYLIRGNKGETIFVNGHSVKDNSLKIGLWVHYADTNLILNNSLIRQWEEFDALLIDSMGYYKNNRPIGNWYYFDKGSCFKKTKYSGKGLPKIPFNTLDSIFHQGEYRYLEINQKK